MKGVNKSQCKELRLVPISIEEWNAGGGSPQIGPNTDFKAIWVYKMEPAQKDYFNYVLAVQDENVKGVAVFFGN